MQIKEILNNCTIRPPHVFIALRFNKIKIEIELCEENDFSDFINAYGDSDAYDWSINNIDGDTYVFFKVKNIVMRLKPEEFTQ